MTPRKDAGATDTATDEASPLADGASSGEVLQEWADLLVRFQAALQQSVAAHASGKVFGVLDPNLVSRTLMQAGAQLLVNPTTLLEFQTRLLSDQLSLWSAFGTGTLQEETPVRDRRFRNESWNQPGFDLLHRLYLNAATHVLALLSGLDQFEPDTARRIRFYGRLLVDAFSPSNFIATNPEVLQRIGSSGGQNLLRGLRNLVEDLERGGGHLGIRMTREDAFAIGHNVAVTPGKIVFQNRLLQLIQYQPTTDTVCRTPLLIVPPWINKYYILDLSPHNSFVRWLTGQGFSVFIVSWVNPDETLADVSWDDYMTEGVLTALDAVGKATGERACHVLGYCIGGTLLACALSWLARRRRQSRIKSVSFLTSLVDFREAGELRVFIDPEQLARLDDHMSTHGYLEGSSMGDVFNLMRDNDLIWSFFVNNYLLGDQPAALDLLYWNQDSTRMPVEMHRYYLREMYLNNRLARPNTLKMAGSQIDLGLIDWPCHLIATREDHIAPWKAAYAATRLYSGPITFTLAASGHVAGVVNPPVNDKYGYWSNANLPAGPDEWVEQAGWTRGSWWPAWVAWLRGHDAEQVPARIPGRGGLAVVEDAPGSYVRVRSRPGSPPQVP